MGGAGVVCIQCIELVVCPVHPQVFTSAKKIANCGRSSIVETDRSLSQLGASLYTGTATDSISMFTDTWIELRPIKHLFNGTDRSSNQSMEGQILESKLREKLGPDTSAWNGRAATIETLRQDKDLMDAFTNALVTTDAEMAQKIKNLKKKSKRREGGEEEGGGGGEEEGGREVKRLRV